MVNQIKQYVAWGEKTLKIDFLFGGAIEGVRQKKITAMESYELWMIPDGGQPVPMGLMNESGTASETVPAELLARLSKAKALAISLEPQGGSPTGQPTGPVLWVAPLVTT